MNYRVYILALFAVAAVTACFESSDSTGSDCSCYIVEAEQAEWNKIKQNLHLNSENIQKLNGGEYKVCLEDKSKVGYLNELFRVKKVSNTESEKKIPARPEQRESESLLSRLINKNFAPHEFTFPDVFDFLLR